MMLACGTCRLSSTQALANPSSALLQGAGATDADGDRFDYNKDPISWFYQVQSSLTGVKGSRHPQQRGKLDTSCAHAAPPSTLQNQIKSEEQFQAKKTELRKAAVERLESVFEKKGKVGGRSKRRMLRHASTP